MAKLFGTERIDEIKTVVKSSKTKTQFKSRKEIAKRLIKYINVTNSDEEFYAKAWNDFPVWSAAFINDDSNNPLFPAPWQNEYARLMAQKKYVWAMCSRKVGKSTLLSVKNLHDMCGLVPKRVICFAPTLKQDFVFDKMGKYLNTSPYLQETFVGTKGSVTKDYINLLNDSSCMNKTIGLTTKGELTRGEYGDIVTVDEVQKIEGQVMRQIIFPIIADAYSEKKMRMLGTPNLYTNPHLERDWIRWKRDSATRGTEYAYMQIDWKRGVEEGCLDGNYVQSEKGRMTPDEFAMEYEALFPEQGSRFYYMGLLEECVDAGASFGKPVSDSRYVCGMAVDWAKFADKTEILLGVLDLQTKLLTYNNWREIDPRVEKIDYEKQVEIVKDMFWEYKCNWICPDATSTQDAIIRMLVTGDKPIPEGCLYTTGDRLGYVATDVLNDQMWRNHRQQMIKGRLRVPGEGALERRFSEMWKREHNELDAKMVRNGQLVKLEEPKNGYKDLAVTSGMLSLLIQKYEVSSPCMDLVGW